MKLTSDYKLNISETMKLINKQYPTINSGGCGAFAGSLGSILAKLGHKVEYVFVCRNYVWKDKINIMIDNENVPELMSGNTDWMHILTVVDNYVIDVNGIQTYRQYVNMRIYNDMMRFSKPFGCKMLNKINSNAYSHKWNRMFDMELIKPIKKELNVNLELSVI